jgi:hypothetical protein
MALITLSDLYDKWKNVSDWVTGTNTTFSPNLQIKNNPLSAVVTLQNAANAIAVGTSLSTNGCGVASIAISGTFVATIIFEGQSADGSWYAINARNRGGGIIASTTTSAGLYEINCMGLTAVRANITAYTSGSVTAKGQAQALTPTSDTFQLTGSIRKLAFSTTTPIGANAVYTSPTIDGINYKLSTFRIISDQSGTFSIQQSDDGITWDTTTPNANYTAPSAAANTGTNMSLRYIRMIYTNGTTPQASFKLSMYISPQ